MTDYLDAGLEAPVQSAAETHLAGCDQCRRLVAEVLAMRETLAAFPSVALPENLIGEVLDRTTGRPAKLSLWKSVILPTLRPFMTPRYAYATAMLFLFLALTVNLVGPPASAVLSPSRLAQSADRFTGQITRKWAEAVDFQARVVEELKLLREDLVGRLDYHFVSMMFKSYDSTVEEQKKKSEAENPDQPEEQPTATP